MFPSMQWCLNRGDEAAEHMNSDTWAVPCGSKQNGRTLPACSANKQFDLQIFAAACMLAQALFLGCAKAARRVVAHPYRCGATYDHKRGRGKPCARFHVIVAARRRRSDASARFSTLATHCAQNPFQLKGRPMVQWARLPCLRERTTRVEHRSQVDMTTLVKFR